MARRPQYGGRDEHCVEAVSWPKLVNSFAYESLYDLRQTPTGDQDKMRVIQAGVGGFGTSWLYALRECEGFEYVALVDPSPEALANASKITGVPAERRFTSVETAIAKVPADGLIDVTPAPCHESTSIP